MATLAAPLAVFCGFLAVGEIRFLLIPGWFRGGFSMIPVFRKNMPSTGKFRNRMLLIPVGFPLSLPGYSVYVFDI
ncbi:hypothetical protein EDC31_10211 [Acidomonas methanolica]|nr:hypothetical protein EDC31_10211 [Acidomonas methanolica]